jgi:hypothetical protein
MRSSLGGFLRIPHHHSADGCKPNHRPKHVELVGFISAVSRILPSITPLRAAMDDQTPAATGPLQKVSLRQHKRQCTAPSTVSAECAASRGVSLRVSFAFAVAVFMLRQQVGGRPV